MTFLLLSLCSSGTWNSCFNRDDAQESVCFSLYKSPWNISDKSDLGHT